MRESTEFPPEEYQARRQKLFHRIGEAMALVQGAGPVERSEPFRQTNEFHYLCGIEAPQAYLLLDGHARKSTLYLTHRDARTERSEGPGLAAEDEAAARAIAGVDAVRPVEDLPLHLLRAREFYTPFSPAEGAAAYRDELVWAAARAAADPWDGRISRECRLLTRLRQQYPGLEIQDLSPFLDELRLIKSPREIARMRRAGELTALGVCEAIRCTRPGVGEWQLGAAAEFVHRVGGARGEGYRAIIASGENIWHAHYYRNDALLKDGDVVLMDYAPDFEYYTSDIGRTWPVGGRFSDSQRELYGFITRYHQALLRLIRPGLTPQQILDEAAEEMREHMRGENFSKPAYGESARRTLSFPGHLSHPVGMCVHDVGSYWNRPLEPGLVFSVDPQMWIPEEKLYVRVEDTVAVTETGIEVLTSAAPLELDALEAMVGAGSALSALISEP